MKRICLSCHKKFVFNKKERKLEILYQEIPSDMGMCCKSCIKDIFSIEQDVENAFWEQSLKPIC